MDYETGKRLDELKEQQQLIGSMVYEIYEKLLPDKVKKEHEADQIQNRGK